MDEEQSPLWRRPRDLLKFLGIYALCIPFGLILFASLSRHRTGRSWEETIFSIDMLGFGALLVAIGILTVTVRNPAGISKVEPAGAGWHAIGPPRYEKYFGWAYGLFSITSIIGGLFVLPIVFIADPGPSGWDAVLLPAVGVLILCFGTVMAMKFYSIYFVKIRWNEEQIEISHPLVGRRTVKFRDIEAAGSAGLLGYYWIRPKSGRLIRLKDMDDGVEELMFHLHTVVPGRIIA
ncbi:hypothetical protein [Glycocaulis alkaliphilus]|uniref:hypothetical protein n=1 Tax=Glycocaulis alkaliphilus TaxID=1434191 RepID=UPI000FDB7BB6|nr:hypothetical protein [Glycocaulis alkaliphilus]GGB72400.1 hypothetical protein GCM10007417_10300 [Glycocaulis alkaliphilus]